MSQKTWQKDGHGKMREKEKERVNRKCRSQMEKGKCRTRCIMKAHNENARENGEKNTRKKRMEN